MKRFLCLSGAVLLLALSSSACQQEKPAPEKPAPVQASCVAPPFLQEGDKIAIITPSYSINNSYIQTCCRYLQSWGYQTVYAPHVGETYPATKSYLAGSPEHRAEDLRWALENDDIKAIVSANGGYGAIQILDLVPLSLYREHPKWMLGFSDFTNLLSASAVAGVMSIHGPTAYRFSTYFTGKTETEVMLRNMLRGDLPTYHLTPNINNIPGDAEGMLVGGNLYTLCALCGTPYDVMDLNGTILFLEETDESMARIDEMFQTLMKQRRLEGVRGIIFGDFVYYDSDLEFQDIKAVFARYTSRLGIPVCFGYRGGHSSAGNNPLIIGAKVKLHVDDDEVTIEYQL
ncbi:MAG: LD-carboxypeptidase [Bacteroidales bacterium]|nr:LD-carboxypeptidase [Bacteroidales bacterium]